MGGFPGNQYETALAKQFSEEKVVGEKVMKLIEALKFGQESASRENDIVNQLSDYLNDILENNESKKTKEEEKDKAFWDKFKKKGSVYYDKKIKS